MIPHFMQSGSAKNTLDIAKKIAIVRIIFGVVWAIDAFFKFEPAFYNGILTMIQASDSGEPTWLSPWFNLWYGIIAFNPHFFAIAILIIELLIALSLLLGIARRLNYMLAAVFSFLLWAVAEGFGGPYVMGSTDIGAGIIYVFVFLLLYIVDSALPAAWSLDTIISKRISWWHILAGRQ